MTAKVRLVEVNGRTVALTITEQVDDAGQFKVAVSVDGKERWAGHFTACSPLSDSV